MTRSAAGELLQVPPAWLLPGETGIHHSLAELLEEEGFNQAF